MIDHKLLQAIVDSNDTKIDQLENTATEIMKIRTQKETERELWFAEHILKPYENKFNKKGDNYDTSQ